MLKWAIRKVDILEKDGKMKISCQKKVDILEKDGKMKFHAKMDDSKSWYFGKRRETENFMLNENLEFYKKMGK